MKRIKQILAKLHGDERGYITIEATIIFPAIFFSLMLLLFMGMVLYQENNLQSLAVRASERGSVIYSSRVTDMTTGVKKLDDFYERDPYRNVPLLDGNGRKNYTGLVNQYVAANLGKYDIISGKVQNSGDYVKVEDYLIAKKIKVRIQSGYRMPVDAIAEMFGKKGPFQVDTTAVSAVLDSPDFVRNVDLTTDVLKQTKLFGTAEAGYQKLRSALNKFKELLK